MAVPSPLGRRQTVAALLTLTFVTGLVDAVSYLRLGRVFVANMTGNVVFLGFSANPHSGLSAATPVIAITGFVLGALAGVLTLTLTGLTADSALAGGRGRSRTGGSARPRPCSRAPPRARGSSSWPRRRPSPSRPSWSPWSRARS